MTAVETVENSEVTCDRPSERTPVADETDLSINQPKKEEVCSATSLPVLTLMENGTPALSDQAVRTAAQEAEAALNPGFLGSVKPEVLKNIIGPMSASDIERLEEAYDKPGQPAGLLRRELRESLPAEQFREVEALLDRKDGSANLAGTIATAIETASARNGRMPLENQEKAGRMIRAAVGTLTTEQLSQLRKDWDERYGKEYGTFDQAIAASKLTDRDKALMTGFYTKGVDQRTAEDIQDAAKLIFNSYSKEWDSTNSDQVLQQFADVIGGDSPAAIAARQALRADPEFSETFKNAFENSYGASETQVRVANDLLSEGRISLSTIISGDTRTLGRFFDNPENISSALMRATPKERQDYLDGRKLAADNADPSRLTPAQADALAFYKKLDATFKDRGDIREQAMWTEQLLTGRKGLLSQLGEQHEKPHWYELFGSEKHSMQGLSSTIENMTSQDWELIRQPKPGQESDYMRSLKESIATYASAEEQQRLFALLDGKARAGSFAESQEVRRSFAEVVNDNSDDSPESRLVIANSLSTMTPADAQALKNNPDLLSRTESIFADSRVDDRDIAAAVYAQSMLKQAAETGNPPVATALDKFSKDVMEGKLDDPGLRLAAVEKLMLEDPALRARMGDVQNLRDQGGSALRNISQEDINLSGLLMMSATNGGYRELLKGEQIPIGIKISMGGGVLGDGFRGHYDDIAKIQPESERSRIVGMLSPRQQEIVQNVIKQGGNPDLADDAQSYLIGDGGSYRELTVQLKQMNDQQRSEFYSSFKAKYGTDFKETFVQGATEREGLDAAHKDLLTVLAGQDFKPTLADDLRAFTLDGGGSYKDFESRLAQLDFTQRQRLKTEFDQKYGVNLDAAFLPRVEPGDKQKYQNLFTAAETDPLSDYLNRVANFDSSGVTPDGTRENVERSLQFNREMLAQYSADREKLPPNVRQALDNYYAEAVKQNLDARDKAAKAAEIAIEVTVMAAALASVPLTGGASLAALSLTEATALVSAASLAGGAARTALISEIRGEGRMTGSDKFDQFKSGMIDGMLLASPLLLGRSAVAAERNIGSEIVVAKPVVNAEVKTASEVGEVVAAKPVVSLDAAGQRLALERAAAEKLAAEQEAARVAAAEKLAAEQEAARVAAAEKLAAEQEAARVAAAEKLAAEQEAARVAAAERAAAEKLAAEQEAARVAAAEKLAAEQEAARVAAAERAAAEKLAAEQEAARVAAAERAAAEKLAAEQEAARVAAAEKLAAEQEAARVAAAEKLAAEQEAARVAAAEKLAAEQEAARVAAAVERPVLAGIDAAAALRLGVPALAVERVAESIITPEVKQEVTPESTVYKPSEQFAALATVRRGEGPWQSAERILASDGKRHGVDEVRALTRAIQAAYKIDNDSSDMSGLRVKYNFATKSDATFNNIIANCKDENVRALLISMAQNG
ncbi:MAG: hypothetical protein IT342_22240 [Candidatus Melainabacteria bacterium]|nr:hypothetical protein [Candidatus Melainabacteria bacterium]